MIESTPNGFEENKILPVENVSESEIPQEEQEGSESMVASGAKVEESPTAPEEAQYPWVKIAEGLGFDGVPGIFENGKCALCTDGGNDENQNPASQFVDRNDLRGMLKHLDTLHSSLKK